MDPVRTPLIFFDNITNIAERIGNASLFICGDFNTVQNEKLDYFNYKTIMLHYIKVYTDCLGKKVFRQKIKYLF